VEDLCKGRREAAFIMTDSQTMGMRMSQRVVIVSTFSEAQYLKTNFMPISIA
jgi:hypothetical protein